MPKGYKHSDQTKAKMSAAKRGNKYSLGLVPSAEVKAKISEALTGRQRPAVSVLKMRATQKRRYKEQSETDG